MFSAVPVVLFAASLAAFEWLTTGKVPALGLWTVAVWAACRAFLLLFPWRRVLAAAGPRPWVMFLLMVRHFQGVLGREAGRVFLARRLSGRSRRWASLAHASAAVMRRTVIRGERFYAGLVARGFE